jgi:hypothetical protein
VKTRPLIPIKEGVWNMLSNDGSSVHPNSPVDATATNSRETRKRLKGILQKFESVSIGDIVKSCCSSISQHFTPTVAVAVPVATAVPVIHTVNGTGIPEHQKGWSLYSLLFSIFNAWYYCTITIPTNIVYYIYIHLPYTIMCITFYAISLLWQMSVVGPYNYITTNLYNSYNYVYVNSLYVYDVVMNTKVSYLLDMIVKKIVALVLSWNGTPVVAKSISITELSELLSYEEMDDDLSVNGAPLERRMKRVMHNYIPPKPFKATVRIRKSDRGNTPIQNLLSSPAVTISGSNSVATEFIDTADSPTSFPCTPFSRAKVLHRSSEKVDSVMFAARDRLRLEAQSASRDEYSRKIALKSQNDGQFAIFDPRQASEGISLTCGNHCALKVGKGYVCSCRAMMHVHVNKFVYLEFSITASKDQSPSISIGLAPPDAPLNVMVGSWPRSVGLYSDGKLLANSRWFHKVNDKNGSEEVGAGATVGFLVYIPDVQSHNGDTTASDTISSTILETVGNLMGLSNNTGHAPCETTAATEDKVKEEKKEEQTECSVVHPFTLKVNINGKLSMFPHEAYESMSDIVSLKAPLYPTVSLLSENTRVWCRFCEADIVYRSREAIGAPTGVPIYCLDGSLLFDSNE